MFEQHNASNAMRLDRVMCMQRVTCLLARCIISIHRVWIRKLKQKKSSTREMIWYTRRTLDGFLLHAFVAVIFILSEAHHPSHDSPSLPIWRISPDQIGSEKCTGIRYNSIGPEVYPLFFFRVRFIHLVFFWWVGLSSIYLLVHLLDRFPGPKGVQRNKAQMRWITSTCIFFFFWETNTYIYEVIMATYASTVTLITCPREKNADHVHNT